MPSQYLTETREEDTPSAQLEREGASKKMVSVAHSPQVRGGKAPPPPPSNGREAKPASSPSGKEKTTPNGGLSHPVLGKGSNPRRAPAAASSVQPAATSPAPRGSDAPPLARASPDDAEIVRNAPIRTQAEPTGTNGAQEKTQDEGERSVCSEAALTYTSNILSWRAQSVRRRQLSLDDRLQRLHSRVRRRQGRGVTRHVQVQLSYAGASVNTKATANVEEREVRETASVPLASSIPMQVDGAVEDVCVDRIAVARSLNFEDFSDQSKRDTSQVIDVVGSSEQPKPPESTGHTHNGIAQDWSRILQNRLGRFDKKRMSEERSEVVERLRQQLRGVCVGLGSGEVPGECRGDEVTDASSDEEGGGDVADVAEESRRQKRLQKVCRRWERDRGPIGAQWAWLRHQIANVNRKLARLDAATQTCSKPEKFALAPSPSSVRTLTHSSSLWGSGAERSKVVNGTNHTPSIPHLLIPDGILSGPIQVKDLLSPSPLNNMSFILNDVGGYTCARTRALVKKPQRKVVRLQQRKQRRRIGPSHAQKSVLPRDTPSWVWLDEGLQHVLQDHPYASFPQPKRRHKASIATRLRMATPSPSPVAAVELDLDKIGGCQRRLLHDLCPRSPSVSRSSTPTPLPTFTTGTPSTTSSLHSSLTPSLPRKKRLPSHAPSYDIDNIVIPYSMAAATRPEKLAYKEVLTPGWREVEATPISHTPSSAQEEDVSDECFRSRHDKFEAQEKKRFMNFISGGQRKRPRPSSLSSDPAHNSAWPPGKVRRATFPVSPSDAPSHHVPILSWPPRSFPLQGSDFEALTNPPPPPPLPIAVPRSSLSSSPSPLLSHPLTPSLPVTPSNSASSLVATPLSSPTTPYSENPISPGEWAVNPQIMPATRPSSVTPGSIVLRLTKKT